jgi:hypothetical protein
MGDLGCFAERQDRIRQLLDSEVVENSQRGRTDTQGVQVYVGQSREAGCTARGCASTTGENLTVISSAPLFADQPDETLRENRTPG